jgi:hypothetical protein
MELVCYPSLIGKNDLPTMPCKTKTIHMSPRPKRSLLSTTQEKKKKQNEKMIDALAKHLCSGIYDKTIQAFAKHCIYIHRCTNRH